MFYYLQMIINLKIVKKHIVVSDLFLVKIKAFYKLNKLISNL